MMPFSLDQNVSTGIRSHPNRSIWSAPDDVCLIGVEPIILSEVLGKQLFSLRSNACNALGINIGDPDRAIGGFRHAEHRVLLESVARFITAPDSVVKTQQPK